MIAALNCPKRYHECAKSSEMGIKNCMIKGKRSGHKNNPSSNKTTLLIVKRRKVKPRKSKFKTKES